MSEELRLALLVALLLVAGAAGYSAGYRRGEIGMVVRVYHAKQPVPGDEPFNVVDRRV